MDSWLEQGILALWIAIFLIWFVTSGSTKRTEYSRSEGRSRMAVWVVWFAWWLLLTRGFGIDRLSRQILPSNRITQYIGLLITLAGLVLAVWARLSIGRNWSPMIELKEDHRVVSHGPYALVRHPIYSGFMAATLGTAIAYRAVAGFLSFVLIVVAWGYKARLEETALLERFGSEYERYRRNVKGLIPFVW